MASDEYALILQISADVTRMEKAFAKAISIVDQGSGRMEHRAKLAGDRLGQFLGHADLGEAVGKVFNRSRLAVFEEGAARIPIFGAAIEALGPAGLAAAAGIAALAISLEHTEKAVEFGAEIAKMAKTVGVGTDFIQAFNYAAKQSEVDVGVADEALKGLNQSLGLVQAGLAKKQLANAFKALGFSPEELRQFHDVGDFFPVMAERIAAVGSEAEKAAIAKRLGVSELLPLLLDGAGGFNKLAAQFHDLGIAMDEGMIKKAEEAKIKLNEIDQVMKAKANVTFLQFADTLIAVKSAFLQATEAGLKFLAIATGTTSTKTRLKELSEQIPQLLATGAAGEPAGRSLLAAKVAEIRALLLKDKIETGIVAPPKLGESAAGKAVGLIDSKPKAARTDRTDVAIEEARAKQLDAHLQLLQALLAQGGDLDRQLAFSRQITEVEKDKVAVEAAKKIDEIAAAKDVRASAKAGLIAATNRAAEDKRAAIDAKAIRAVMDLQLEAQQRALDQFNLLNGFAISTLDAESQLARTQRQRADLEGAALKRRQDQDIRDLSQTFAGKIAHGQATEADRETAVAALKGQQAADRAVQSHNSQGPLAAFFDAAPKAIAEVDAAFRSFEAQGLGSLNSGLADAIVNAKSLGDVGAGVFKQLTAQVIELLLQASEAKLASSFGLPGFATGTDFAPGGLALVGERGPEVVSLPRGSQVIPHGLGLGGLAGQGGGAPVYITADFKGAVVTQDLIASFQAYADRASQQARLMGAAEGKAGAISALQQRARSRLGVG
jgi:hypothetical protein